MKEEGLELSDLPKDAQTCIKEIKKAERGVAMQRGKGREPSEAVTNKLSMLDKQATREILEHLDNDNSNTDANDNESDNDNTSQSTANTNDAEKKEDVVIDTKGYAIEKELAQLYNDGVKEITIDDIQKKAQTCYSVIFDSYEDGQENGVETSRYKLAETSNEVFVLSKL